MQLTGKLLDICSGRTALPAKTVLAYRAAMAARGYSLPAYVFGHSGEDTYAVQRTATAAAIAKYAPRQCAVVTRLGISTLLRVAIEVAGDFNITHEPDLQYLQSLDASMYHDADEITANLTAILHMPPQLESQYDTQLKRQAWLQPIVETALLSWVASP